MKTTEIVDKLRQWAPESSQEPWDKSGWQLKLKEREAENVLVAMDITEEIVDLAIEVDAALILTHHPFLFSGLDRIDTATAKGNMVATLIREEISVYSAHTSMDKAEGGVNDQWIPKFGLKDVSVLSEEDALGIVGRGQKTLSELKQLFEDEGIRGIRCYGRKKDAVETIAFVGGSGADYIDDAVAAGADLLITGDVKHHDGQYAYEKGLMVIDIGHFHSEKAILDAMAQWVERISDAKAHVVMNSSFVFEI